eukprot:CAMPEP_0174749782 /NCGR_PEP_ID=MMETSP1094-20130205/96388_1 /TAXON_ID=156173 /ORGANISM="Chrysochromulina brevifilum, Strain UTEX LB 985" /LENGTH=66 /DNA_ID=CAMNT_0015955035 /DNA_START=365 /DNA_END=565 /DNA_ORIENTATION=-
MANMVPAKLAARTPLSTFRRIRQAARAMSVKHSIAETLVNSSPDASMISIGTTLTLAYAAVLSALI